ncbi:MAG: DUF5682 family protein [Pseudomonadota bacterium]
MDDTARLESVRGRLFQPEAGLFFAPIRHHSPACAWAVSQLIREIRPRQILIEFPSDLEAHIDLLVSKDTVPPVALAVLIDRDEKPRVAAHYPMCTHSPEYVALIEGQSVGAALRFIDLPSADKLQLAEPALEQSLVVDDEGYFDSGDFIASMCTKTGCRNGFELWDHLFESRLGESDWRALLGDIGAYCAALRDTTPPSRLEVNGDHAREQHMAVAVHEAVERDGPTVVITGGFHTPALIDAIATPLKSKRRTSTGDTPSYLIRYSFEALDALSGYAAGLPQPGFYDYLWKETVAAKGALPWRQTALNIVSSFSRQSREDGHDINVPAQVEMLRVAESLAKMRGRPGASRYDLIDAARAALVKGEAGGQEVWTERLLGFLRGHAIGDIPPSVGTPPIVEDARSRAKRLRIDVSDGARRRRRLDIRRKPSHLAASRYFHAMNLIDANFAAREQGPDFVNDVHVDRLFEEWTYAWSPTVEGRLVELSVLGDTIESASLNLLHQRRAQMRAAGQGRDIAAMAALFVQGILAGLGAELGPFLRDVSNDVQAHADFSAVAQTLRRLHGLSNAAGPLALPPALALDQVCDSTYRRLVYLCDDLPKTPAEAIQPRIEALRLMMELLRAPGFERLDRNAFDEAISRVAEANPPPEILGAVLAIALQANLKTVNDIGAALRGSFVGTLEREQDRVGVLRGLLFTMPEILWRSETILEEVDRLLGDLSEERFLEQLPHIRLAFTSLNPREADQVAESLGRLHGGEASAFMAHRTGVTEHDLERGVALERALARSLAGDHLTSWLEDKS